MKEIKVFDKSRAEVTQTEPFGADAENVNVTVDGVSTDAESAVEDILGMIDEKHNDVEVTSGVIVDDVGALDIDMGNIKAGVDIDGMPLDKLMLSAYGAKNSVTVLHISDTHQETECIDACIAEAKRDSDISFIINTGDIETASYNRMAAADCGQPVLGILGNHDIRDIYGENGRVDAGHARATAAMYALNGNNVVWGATENGAPTNSYWYKDVTTAAGRTIRFVAVNDYDDSNGAAFNYEVNYTPEQMDWLYNLLLNTPSSYYLVFLKHEPVQQYVNVDNANDWTYKISSPRGLNNEIWLPNIIKAYTSHSVFSGRFYAQYRDALSFDYSMDFSSLTSHATFLCYLCGHTHCDWHTYLDSPYNDQLMLCITAANKNVYKNDWYADNDRGQIWKNGVLVVNGRSDISYIGNKVTFDLGMKQIVVNRFGSPYIIKWASANYYEPNLNKIRDRIVFKF